MIRPQNRSVWRSLQPEQSCPLLSRLSCPLTILSWGIFGSCFRQPLVAGIPTLPHIEQAPVVTSRPACGPLSYAVILSSCSRISQISDHSSPSGSDRAGRERSNSIALETRITLSLSPFFKQNTCQPHSFRTPFSTID